jgi:hypothetical protein
MAEHPLLRVLLDAAAGRFPAPDGSVTVLPPLADDHEVAMAFTAHAVFATALPPDEVRALGADGYGGAMAPDVLRGLAGGGWVGVLDVTLAGVGRGGGALPRRTDLDDHPRVLHARDLRRDVQVFGDERGLVTIASGLAGRRELSIELTGDRQGRGEGMSLLLDGLGLVEEGAAVFAGVAPGNARSLRLFLHAGFVPLASEVQIRPQRRPS